MFSNETNIIEKIKFKKGTIVKLTYIGVFALWVIAFFMIKNIEKSNEWASVYYIFSLAFAFISFITALIIKNDRDKTLSFYKFGMLGYTLYIVLFQLILLGINYAGVDDGSAISLLSQICHYSEIVVPLGLVVWQAKKWTFLTGINKNKKDTVDYLKKHGNDGM